MSETKYNGWTNYETWLVNLWIDNEEGLQNYWQEASREVFDAEFSPIYPGQTKANRAKSVLCEQLKSEIEERAPATVGLYADLLTAAIQSVNFYEIASNWIDALEAESEVA